jgi:hypothetical protein
MTAPAKKFYYWRNQKGGPRKGVLILRDRIQDFNLDDGESYLAGSKVLGESVGIALLVPADGKYQVSGIGWDQWDKKYDTVESAVAGFWAEQRRLEAEQNFLEKNPDVRLERALKTHDWYSSYSDDHQVWAAGEAANKELARLVKLVDQGKVRELWAKYAPKDFSCPI